MRVTVKESNELLLRRRMTVTVKAGDDSYC